MIILDGKHISQLIKDEIKTEVNFFVESGQRKPHLVTILVGHDGGSEVYVRNKIKACKVCGFNSTVLRFDNTITEKELLIQIQNLNQDPTVDGFIVQLPLPSHINKEIIINAIDYRKDVDGFHPLNVGRLFSGLPTFISATPLGIFELLKRYNISTTGKHCVIIGRSNTVGKPLSALMMQKKYGDATVTVCHSHTKDLIELTKNADILITAMGCPNFIKSHMVKDGVVIIDVGTTRIEDSSCPRGKLLGDVDFPNIASKCSYITPVPGGVGPMTIAMLMSNTMKAYRGHLDKQK